MKTLSNYILEKLVINKHYETDEYFVYNHKDHGEIQIFGEKFEQLNDYINNVYINGEKAEIREFIGTTKKQYEPGIYKVKIANINDIRSCENMFIKCNELIEVPIFDTSKVKNMKQMFYGCTSLLSIPELDFSSVEDMTRTFSQMINVEHLPELNLLNCKKLVGTFGRLEHITTIKLTTTDKLKEADYAFFECMELENVPLFNVDNVKKLDNMFGYCKHLSIKTMDDWGKIYDFMYHKRKL